MEFICGSGYSKGVECDELDLSNLKNIKLGNCSFCLSSTTVMESIERIERSGDE